MQPTDTRDPQYYHRVVDCQWACPAHTPVPEYIRLIAEGRFTESYMLNRKSNVFPGILGRTCEAVFFRVASVRPNARVPKALRGAAVSGGWVPASGRCGCRHSDEELIVFPVKTRSHVSY